MASIPRTELDAWVGLVLDAGAVPVFVCPWQKALLAAGGSREPSALYLALAPSEAYLVWFRGRNLRFMRTFPLPPGPARRRPSPPARHYVKMGGSAIARFSG